MPICSFFFFNDPATTEIYTLSLHDALPIFFVSSLLPTMHKTNSYLPGICSIIPQGGSPGLFRISIPPKQLDRKSTRLNSSHVALSRMPSSAWKKKKNKKQKKKKKKRKKKKKHTNICKTTNPHNRHSPHSNITAHPMNSTHPLHQRHLTPDTIHATIPKDSLQYQQCLC